MTKFDEVKRLTELEAKATCAPWDLLGKIDFQIVADNPDFYISFADSDREDPQLITDLRNAAPWLLEVAGKFQPGDAALLKRAAYEEADAAKFIAGFGHPDLHVADMLSRLADAAEIMESE